MNRHYDKKDEISLHDLALLYKDNEFPFSRGINNFGIERCLSIFTQFNYHYRLPCVSIGSGIGLFEKLAMERGRKDDIHIPDMILVEPDPFLDFRCMIEAQFGRDNVNRVMREFRIILKEKFNLPFPHLKPNFTYLKELLKVFDNSLYRKSTLLLNWCDPTEKFTYDYDAIRALRPVSIFVIYERTELKPGYYAGASGTHKFHEFMRFIENTTAQSILDEPNDIQEINALADEYKIIHSLICKKNEGLRAINFKIVWLERKDREIIFLPPNTSKLPFYVESQCEDETYYPVDLIQQFLFQFFNETSVIPKSPSSLGGGGGDAGLLHHIHSSMK